MPTRIDHVIIAAPELAPLEDIFTRLGFTVTGGGAHPHLGTRNRIIVLGEGYIELLALADAARASEALRERIARGGGWIGYALQSDDIAAEAERMRARGVDVRGPARGSLVAPHGMTRGWQVVTVGSDDLWTAALPLPFLIQHDSTGEQHQRELAGEGSLAPHQNSSARLVGVTLTTADLAALRKQYERVYGLTSASQPTTPSQRITYPLRSSGEWISLAPAPKAGARMSVTVGVSDLEAVRRAMQQAGLPATEDANTISVSIPNSGAELRFTQLDGKG